MDKRRPEASELLALLEDHGSAVPLLAAVALSAAADALTDPEALPVAPMTAPVGLPVAVRVKDLYERCRDAALHAPSLSESARYAHAARELVSAVHELVPAQP